MKPEKPVYINILEELAKTTLDQNPVASLKPEANLQFEVFIYDDANKIN